MTFNSSFDPKQLRDALGQFPSGVAAIASMHQGERNVIVASSFTVGVSLEPPLAAFFIQKTSSTWPVLSQAPRIGVSVLSAEHAGVCRQLAGRNKAARFEAIPHHVTAHGAIRMEHSSVWFECTVHDVYSAGDHWAVLLRIHDLALEKSTAPLVFHNSKFTQPAHCAAQAVCT